MRKNENDNIKQGESKNDNIKQGESENDNINQSESRKDKTKQSESKNGKMEQNKTSERGVYGEIVGVENDAVVSMKLEKLNEMREKSTRRFATLLAFAIVFCVGFVLFGTLYTSVSGARNQYAFALEASYERAIYDIADNINSMEVNLSKTQVATDKGLQRKYLQLVCDNCKYAQSNFQILPLTLSVTREGVKFINQMDGFCTSLISADKALNDSEKQKIGELLDITLELKTAINGVIEKVMQGYNILQGSEKDFGDIDEFSASFNSISADSISYPSMIFDGPFSDSLTDREIKGLPDVIVSSEVAKEMLASVLDEMAVYDDLRFTGQGGGDFETYDFTITSGENTLYASVARRGGFLLTLSGVSSESEEPTFSIDECEQKAVAFATLCGAVDMQAVWSDSEKGVAFINLAPVLSGVIYYPDLIKVKVDMSSGQIVGYEAQSYAFNHTDRVVQTPTISAVQSRDLLDARLNINTQKLCVIPLDYGGEVLCYEFFCTYYGSDYYVYINAFTGDEEKVLKVVATTMQGTLTT